MTVAVVVVMDTICSETGESGMAVCVYYVYGYVYMDVYVMCTM